MLKHQTITEMASTNYARYAETIHTNGFFKSDLTQDHVLA